MVLKPDEFNRGYFPDPSLAGEDGLLAAGGTLDTGVLLEAYSRGIFPWYSEGSPILWWSPDPRMILFPEDFKVSRSLDRTIRKRDYEIRVDTAFREVISHCASQPRAGQKGTWITPEMIDAYIRLHDKGYAHSFETWKAGRMVGGLYGISLGGAFFGESMFHYESDSSKVAFFYLVEFARRHNFHFIDAQQPTGHLESLGAAEVPRKDFLELLEKAMKENSLAGSWSEI
jgi:leucyl/phenylalanyl-tRNA--protein transferase